ncbi:hypothetical protein SH1V18_20480 [Vallitalea longa]|jgi:hypothetical protein|uniref:DUF2680 domain-containing protein n=1 Tax=Vallitalea longa TaxID=2936439 RepID=A0A9W6DFM1_9FIRM|nr:hypothetical protein [Vallitalea longa]GKX29568.1 hypothetical protein SH1V18_20480 [Vallitalea longa]
MKTLKNITIGLLGTLLIGTVAFAATPAEIYSEVTGVTEEEAYDLRQDGQTFGELAEENGVYEEFTDKMLEEKITIIEDKVDQELLTREEADELIAKLKDNVGNCDPSNPPRLGQEVGLNCGNGNGKGNGACNGARLRNGNGNGNGNGYGRNGGRGYGLGRKN